MRAQSILPLRRALAAVALLAAATAVGDAFTNDLAYLKRKWRANVTDAGTGLDTGGVLAGWREIVAARGNEPWETTKAKIFAFGCDRTAIGVSPHDWFPAFAPWSFHRGHPLWNILPQRAAEVDARRSPGLAKKIGAGTKDGRWVVWKDYSHCAPDWDDILTLGFPGMRDRLLANWTSPPTRRSASSNASPTTPAARTSPPPAPASLPRPPPSPASAKARPARPTRRCSSSTLNG